MGGVVVNFLDIGNGAERGDNFLQFGGVGDVVQVKHFHHLLFQFAALGGVIESNEDRVARQRLPERFRQQRKIVERLIECGVLQLNRLRANRVLLFVIRVEQNVDAS